MPDDRTIADDEREDEDDRTPAGIARRLTKVSKILARANARLLKLDSLIVNPPEGDKPAIRAALGSVKAETDAAQLRVDDMLRRV